MKTQKGFTLIELIIVIVVLGILAVTAAPQFFNFSTDARESTLSGLKGSMNGAADLVYGKAAIAGVESDADDGAATPAYQTVDSIEIVNGYPAATVNGIVAALNIETADWDIYYDVEPAAVGTQRTVVFSPAGVNTLSATPVFADIDECFVSYTDVAPASPGDRPTITIDTTGC